MTVKAFSDFFDSADVVLLRGMTDGLKYVAAFAGALAVSLALTPLCREGARRLGMIDHPDARRINKTPTPRGGGLAVFLAFHVALGVLAVALGGEISKLFSLRWQMMFLLASSILVTVGLVDDKYGMRPTLKLGGQVLVASILFAAGVRVGGIVVAFPFWLNYLVTVLWIVGVVNAFNLIDGMDGLATGLALIASVGLAGALLFTGESAETLPYLILAGACLGFLRYNFHPATVFLGDTGSMFLGLCLATLPLMTGSRKELLASVGVPLLALGVPLFDTLLAIWRRTVRALMPGVVTAAGKRVRLMQPDKDHVHHRLLRDTMNQRTAAAILYGISASLVAVGLIGSLLKGRAPGLFLIAFIVAIFVVVRHLERVELWDTGRLLSPTRHTVRQGLIIPLSIVADVLVLCGVWVLSRWLSGLSLGRACFLGNLPLFVVPSFVSLVVAKTYWRVWSRALVRDLAVLITAVLTGALLGLALAFLFEVDRLNLIRFTVLYGALGVIPLSAMRLWRDSLSGMLQGLERRVLLERPGTRRVLAYGGGLRFRSFLRELGLRSGHNDRVIVGLIDDDIHLKGRIVAGYTVLGGVDELGRVAKEVRADLLIVTCLLDEAGLSRVASLARALGLELSVWVCEERPFAGPGGKADGAQASDGARIREA